MNLFLFLGPLRIGKSDVPDVKIFSSVMLRSIETALHNFKGMDVYPTPWIAESGMGSDNKPTAWADQKAYMKSHGESDLIKHVMYGQKGGVPTPNAEELADSAYYSNYELFLNAFPGMLKVSTLFCSSCFVMLGTVLSIHKLEIIVLGSD